MSKVVPIFDKIESPPRLIQSIIPIDERRLGITATQTKLGDIEQVIDDYAKFKPRSGTVSSILMSKIDKLTTPHKKITYDGGYVDIFFKVLSIMVGTITLIIFILSIANGYRSYVDKNNEQQVALKWINYIGVMSASLLLTGYTIYKEMRSEHERITTF